MNYGYLFSKAWDMIWKNKFMIFLGTLVAISGIGGGSGGSQGFRSSGEGSNFQNPPRFDFDFFPPTQGFGVPLLGVIVVLLILIVLLALWVMGTISRGGLIYAADRINTGETANLTGSLQAGWSKAWRLIGIGLVPAIPVLLLAGSIFLSAGFYTGGRVVLQEGEVFNAPNALIFIPALTIVCFLVPITLGLSLLRTFANRACMLEDRGVIGSYRRGLEVLGNNLGAALILFLLQIAVSVAIGLVLFVPGILVALCCIFWPLLVLVQGAFAAFYSTLWTLAWDQWTAVPNLSN